MTVQQIYDSPGHYSLDVSDVNNVDVYMEGGGGGVGGANEVVTEPERGPGGHGASATGTIDTEDVDTLEIQVGGGGGGGGSGFSVVADGGDGGFPNGGRGGDATAGDDNRSDSGAGGGGGGSTEVKAGDGTVLVITDGGGGGGGQEQNDPPGGGGGGGRGGSGRNGGEDGDGDGNGGDGAQADANGRADPGGGETHETLFDGSVETGGANNGDDDEPLGVIELEYTPAPSAPSGLEAISGDTSVTLSWMDNDDEQPARVFRDREPGVTPESTLIEEVPNGSETYEDTSAKQGIQYYYAVFAYDPENDVYSSASNEAEPFITLPAPTDLTVGNVGDETVDLSWIDNAEDEEGYRIEADKDDEGEWEIVEDGLAPGTESATATGLLNGQLYGLRVIAFTEDTEEVDV